MPTMREDLTRELRDPLGTCRRGDGFADQLELTDGVIRGRAVPYGVTVQLAPGLFERFAPGAFRHAVRAPYRVRVCLEHGQVVGRVTKLDDGGDGLWFVGRISDSPDIPEARKARAMLADGLADELSVGFRPVPNGTVMSTRDDGTVLWEHKRAQLTEISLVPWGVYGREATVTRARTVDLDVAARRENARRWVREFANLR